MKLADLAKKLIETIPDTTDGRCDPVCYAARVILVLAGPRPTVLDAWRDAVREESGEPFDWHFMGGRAVFRSPGDYQKVAKAISHLLPAIEWAHALSQEAEHPDYVFPLMVHWVES